MTTDSPDISATASNAEVRRGSVNVAAIDVRIAYGFDTESFHLVLVQTANVISTAMVWNRYAAPDPLPKGARAQLTEALSAQAEQAIAAWSSEGESTAGTRGGAAAPTSPTGGGAPVAGTFDQVDPGVFANQEVDGVHFLSPSGDAGCVVYPQDDDSPLWGCTMFDKNWEFESDSPDDFCFEAPTCCGDGIETVGVEMPEPRLRGDVGYPAAMAMGEGGGATTGVTPLPPWSSEPR